MKALLLVDLINDLIHENGAINSCAVEINEKCNRLGRSIGGKLLLAKSRLRLREQIKCNDSV